MVKHSRDDELLDELLFELDELLLLDWLDGVLEDALDGVFEDALDGVLLESELGVMDDELELTSPDARARVPHSSNS